MKEIFCTLGPSSTNPKFLKNIKRLGVTLVRINLSHTKIKDLSKIIRKIRKYTNIPICIDTEGAQIRTALCKKKFLRINQFIKISNEKKSKDLTLYPDISSKRLVFQMTWPLKLLLDYLQTLNMKQIPYVYYRV